MQDRGKISTKSANKCSSSLTQTYTLQHPKEKQLITIQQITATKVCCCYIPLSYTAWILSAKLIKKCFTIIRMQMFSAIYLFFPLILMKETAVLKRKNSTRE